MKVIYLVESKFCKRDYDRFGIEILCDRGYSDIEVWDLSAWFRPDYFNKYRPADLIAGENYKSISSNKVAIGLLKLLPRDSIFVCILKPSIKSMAFFSYLNKNNFTYGFLSFGYFPVRGNLYKIKKILNDPLLILKRLVNLISVKMYTLATLSIHANFVILGGGVATSGHINSKTVILKGHTLDYDLFLSADFTSTARKKENIVFLDDNGPNHPDDIDRNTAFTAETYYRVLNNFFNSLEVKLGMEVIIAPHPRSDYKRTGNPFNGRIISDLTTIQTIKESSVVISHGSTATSFAVLYNKPMLFMLNRLYPSYSHEGIKNMAKVFHKEPIDISVSDFIIQDSDLIIDSDAYNFYKELYIKESGTPEKKTWDIFADYLDTI